MADKPAQIKKPKKKDKGLKTADSVNKITNSEIAASMPIAKPSMVYKRAYLSGIEDDSKKTVSERKANSISRLDEIEKLQYKNADMYTKGKKIKEIAKIAAQNKKNKEAGLKAARFQLKMDKKIGAGSAYAKKQQSAKAIDTGSTFAKGGRTGYKDGKSVEKKGLSSRTKGSDRPSKELDFSKKNFSYSGKEMQADKKARKSRTQSQSRMNPVPYKSGGRAGYSVGGRAMRGVSKILIKK